MGLNITCSTQLDNNGIIIPIGKTNERVENMAKPGPKPRHGESMSRYSVRLTDECHEWTRKPELGGAGNILQSIYQSDRREAFEKWFIKEIAGNSSDELS